MLQLSLLHNNWYQNSRLDLVVVKEKIMSRASLTLVQGNVHTSFDLDVESMITLFKESLIGLRQSSLDKE